MVPDNWIIEEQREISIILQFGASVHQQNMVKKPEVVALILACEDRFHAYAQTLVLSPDNSFCTSLNPKPLVLFQVHPYGWPRVIQN